MIRGLNYFPVKGGLLPYHSPRNIVYQQPLDYNKHLTTPLGAFVQSNNENNSKNSKKLQKNEGVYLRTLDKKQGRHEIFDLNSHRVITRRKIIEIPIHNAIIKHIEELSACDKVT